MVGTHTEAVLKTFNKQELVQLFFSIEVNMGSKLSAMSSDIKISWSTSESWKQMQQ